jgi:glycosyltransferase involved in cell wall biosynthesis
MDFEKHLFSLFVDRPIRRIYNNGIMAASGENDFRIFLSVVIPAFNEEKEIGNTLGAIRDYLDQRYSYEIIVADDGSLDGTAAAVEKFAGGKNNIRLVRSPVNRGKGYSVRQGINAAAGELCLIIDADLSIPITELEQFTAYIKEGYDIVIASRFMKGSSVSRSSTAYRLFGRIFNLIVRVLFGLSHRDTQCGFKLLKSEHAKKIFLECRIDRFAFDIELLVKARRMGLRIMETPVSCVSRFPSSVRLFTDSAIMFKDIIILRMRS